MARQIEHDGIVIEQRGELLSVEILNRSACATCNAKGLCAAADEKKKRIDVKVDSGYSFAPGDHVVVFASNSIGLRAVALAYVAPVVLVLSVLMVCYYFGASDSIAGITALSSLLPYFLVIYHLRKRLRKSLVFRVKKQKVLQ